MNSVEAEAGTIDEAIEKALEQLGASREQVEIEIVSNATRGLFGLGGKKAVVRATLRSPISLAEESAAPRRATTEAAPAIDPAAKREARPRQPAPRPAAAAATRTAPPEDSEPLDAKTLEQAREALAETVRLMQTEATVDLASGADGPELRIDGDDSGLLIGRRGQTLDALEYVVNRIISRDAGETTHLVVDSQGYRVRRRESLRDLSKRLAERARKRGTAVTMNPMSPRDRRVVHLALQDDPSIETRSTGKGHFRKLTIAPKGARRPRSRSNRSQPRRAES